MKRLYWLAGVISLVAIIVMAQKPAEGEKADTSEVAKASDTASVADKAADTSDVAKASDTAAVAEKASDTAEVAEKAADTTAKGKEPKIITTKSGLQYIELNVGEGEVAVAGMKVDVHYTGWLYIDGKKGKKFDSSVDKGTPFSFPLGAGRVIKGWDEGVAGMKIGGKRQLIIPPELGYGARGAAGGSIPPNATLTFDIELLKVYKK